MSTPATESGNVLHVAFRLETLSTCEIMEAEFRALTDEIQVLLGITRTYDDPQLQAAFNRRHEVLRALRKIKPITRPARAPYAPKTEGTWIGDLGLSEQAITSLVWQSIYTAEALSEIPENRLMVEIGTDNYKIFHEILTARNLWILKNCT